MMTGFPFRGKGLWEGTGELIYSVIPGRDSGFAVISHCILNVKSFRPTCIYAVYWVSMAATRRSSEFMVVCIFCRATWIVSTDLWSALTFVVILGICVVCAVCADWTDWTATWMFCTEVWSAIIFAWRICTCPWPDRFVCTFWRGIMLDTKREEELCIALYCMRMYRNA